MSTALTLQPQGPSLAKAEPTSRSFEPAGVDEAFRMAKLLVQSGLMPSHIRTPEAAFAIIATGRELGLTALQSMRSIYFFNGKVTLSADLMVACAKRHPECEYFRLVECSNERCVAETQRRGEEPTRMTWTLEDARRADLLGKGPWKQFPKAMLRARVSADLCRAVYPDACMGLYDPDELGARSDTTEVSHIAVAPAPNPSESPNRSEEPTLSPVETAQLEASIAFGERIDLATTPHELTKIAWELKKAALPALLLKSLRNRWKAQSDAVKLRPVPPPSQPTLATDDGEPVYDPATGEVVA